MSEQKPRQGPADLTPLVGAQTDISRLGRADPKPIHERTADEDIDVIDWQALAADPAFRALLARKKRFILPATVFFILYYFALPVAVGYWPEEMARPVLGAVNLAYLFALSQFFVAWILAGLYIVIANRFDRESEDLIRCFRSKAKS